jgi:amidophosphoribosyltransferase
MNRAGTLHCRNLVRNVYEPFKPQELSDKIARLITPPELDIPVQLIYQTIEDLHESCPTNTGDWYFTGITLPLVVTGFVTGIHEFYGRKECEGY